MKLTTPFAMRRSVSIQRRKLQGVVNMATISVAEARRSIMLNGSPVKMKRPLRKSSPAQNKIICVKGVMPNMINKNVSAASMSSAPKTLTNMQKRICLGLLRFG